MKAAINWVIVGRIAGSMQCIVVSYKVHVSEADYVIPITMTGAAVECVPFQQCTGTWLKFVFKSYINFAWYLTFTETLRLIRDGEKWGEGGMEVVGEGDYIPIATLSPPE